MTDKETITLFGDLVKAGILSKSEAQNIYHGVIPLDVSDYDGTTRGTLSKFNGVDPVSSPKSGFANIPGEKNRGYSEFAGKLEQLKDSGVKEFNSSYVDAYDGFLKIMEQLKRGKIVNTY